MSNSEEPTRQKKTSKEIWVKVKCKTCYDKGYSTAFKGVIGYPDFIGDKGYFSKPRIRIKFCNCPRGKQLKRLIETNYTERK